MRRLPLFREIIAGEALLFVAALFQGTALLTIAGVKPNIVLVFLVALAFAASNFTIYFFFVLGGIFFLRFSPAFEVSLLALGAICLFVFIIKERLPWQEFVNCLICIAFATITFYLFLDTSFIGREPLTVLAEVAYNMAIGTAAFSFVRWALGYHKYFYR